MKHKYKIIYILIMAVFITGAVIYTNWFNDITITEEYDGVCEYTKMNQKVGPYFLYVKENCEGTIISNDVVRVEVYENSYNSFYLDTYVDYEDPTLYIFDDGEYHNLREAVDSNRVDGWEVMELFQELNIKKAKKD